MNKIEFNIILNCEKGLNGFNKRPIQIEATLNKQKELFSTHVLINTEQWDKNKSLIINHPNAELLNRMIQEFVLHLETMELNYWKRGTPIGLKELKNIIENSSETSFECNFIDFARKNIEYSTKRKTSTKKNLLTTLNLLSDYRQDITIEQLDYSFITEFENYLLKNNYKINTIAKHLRHIRCLYNDAVKKGLTIVEKSPFKHYSIKTDKTKYSFLLPEELVCLESLILEGKNKKYSHSLDAFLFCCYTGLRYSDFVSLSDDNFIKIDNVTWIILRTKKTDTEVRLPLNILFNGKALSILKKYKNKYEYFFKIKSNSFLDKDLIKIAKLAGINKHFSFHSARHTNATLLIYKGVNITTVQKLLGHKNIKTTQIYTDIIPETIINDLKRHK